MKLLSEAWPPKSLSAPSPSWSSLSWSPTKVRKKFIRLLALARRAARDSSSRSKSVSSSPRDLALLGADFLITTEKNIKRRLVGYKNLNKWAYPFYIAGDLWLGSQVLPAESWHLLVSQKRPWQRLLTFGDKCHLKVREISEIFEDISNIKPRGSGGIIFHLICWMVEFWFYLCKKTETKVIEKARAIIYNCLGSLEKQGLVLKNHRGFKLQS